MKKLFTLVVIGALVTSVAVPAWATSNESVQSKDILVETKAPQIIVEKWVAPQSLTNEDKVWGYLESKKMFLV